jgi:5-methylcytosine-specific restriction endonuclease McrA
MKLCAKCNSIEFYKSGACKKCAKEYALKWQKNNPEKLKIIKSTYFIKNRTAVIKLISAWQKNNPKKMAEKARRYYLNNKEKVLFEKKLWKNKNKSLVKIYRQNYRIKKLINGGKISKGLEERLFKLQRGKCPCCNLPLGNNYHLDHIVPISRGGENIDSNIQLLRSTCNQQKHAKDPIDYMQSKGFLI